MARFDWFAWHRNYRTDEWIHSLTEAERWAWVAFLSYANETDFLVNKCNVTLLSPLLSVTPVTLNAMLKSAIENGKVVETEDAWFVKNGDKYRVGVDKTNAERQAKYRETQRLKENESNGSNGSVTGVTRYVTLPVKTETLTKTNTNTPETAKAVSVPNPELVKAVEIWNELKSESWPRCEKIVNPLPARFKAATNSGEFELPEIINRARGSDFLNSKRFVTLLWLVSRSEKTGNLNAQDILDGRYANNQNGHTPKSKAGYLGAGGESKAKF